MPQRALRTSTTQQHVLLPIPVDSQRGCCKQRQQGTLAFGAHTSTPLWLIWLIWPLLTLWLFVLLSQDNSCGGAKGKFCKVREKIARLEKRLQGQRKDCKGREKVPVFYLYDHCYCANLQTRLARACARKQRPKVNSDLCQLPHNPP